MLKSLNLKYSIEKKKCMYIFVSFFHCSKHIWIKQVIIYQEMQQKEERHVTHTSARSSSDCQTTTASQLTGSLQVGVGVGGWKEKGKKKKHTTSAGSEALRTVYCTQYRLSESQQCKKHIVRGGS